MGSTTSPHIPIVDFAPFLLPPSNHNSSPSLRQQTAKTLAESCHQHGCAAITGHGVSKELLERAFEVSKGLFDLSVEEKMLAPHPEGMVPHRGYSGFGRERAGGKGGVEVKGEGDDYKVCFSLFFFHKGGFLYWRGREGEAYGVVYFRKATRLGARGIESIITSGCRKTSCLVFATSRLCFIGG